MGLEVEVEKVVAKEGFSFRLKEVESEIVGGWFVHVKFGYCCVKSVS
jgi:hypothetical protein